LDQIRKITIIGRADRQPLLPVDQSGQNSRPHAKPSWLQGKHCRDALQTKQGDSGPGLIVRLQSSGWLSTFTAIFLSPVQPRCGARCLSAMQEGYDLLIRAMRIVCPASGLDSPGAVAVRADRIVAVGPAVAGMAARVLNLDDAAPDTISTDLQHGHIGQEPVHDLPLVMSKLRAAGMAEREVFAAVTSRPARVLGLAHEIGALKVGSRADLVLLRWRENGPRLVDVNGNERPGGRWETAATVRAGRLVPMPSGRENQA
jgi:hypothetical protein